MSTRDRSPSKAVVVTTSPLFAQQLKRLAADRLELVVERTPTAVLDYAELELVFLQEELASGPALSRWLTSLRASPSPQAPVIAFSRDPQAQSRALAHGASGFLTLPCRSEEFLPLVDSWLSMQRPHLAVADPRRDDALPVGAESAAARPAATILLVDDSALIHAFVEKALSGRGHTLLHAHDGVEGLAVARRTRPDLIISDIDMPNLDGYEMCRQLREDSATQDITLLVLSARAAAQDSDRRFEAGIDDFLSKPVSEHELAERVEQLLALRQGPVGGREEILLVEGNAAHRGLLRHVLTQQGFRVRAVASPRGALDGLATSRPQLCILDAPLQSPSTPELLDALRAGARYNNVPFALRPPAP